MLNRKNKVLLYIVTTIFTIISVFPFAWMILLSFKTNNQIMSDPLSLPTSLNFANYIDAVNTLNYAQMYGNTFLICVVAILLEIFITFMSSFAIARMDFNANVKNMAYSYLIIGLSVSPFILLFPVYRISTILHFSGKPGLALVYAATSISFNTLLLTNYLRTLPAEIDEAAIIDGANLRQLIVSVILPLTKPVMATVIIFNVLYVWNEYPFASIMLRNISDYTLSMGASFFKGKYTVNYGGIIASSIIIIIPELIFYGIFQKNIVDGMVSGAVKG